MIATPLGAFRRRARLRVVLFSGGRGSGALAGQLLRNPAIDLTIAINGYDDGASTGEVRRFLGDSLGPSDFRKNASRVAAELGTASPDLIALLERRLAAGSDQSTFSSLLTEFEPDARTDGAAAGASGPETLPGGAPWLAPVRSRLGAFGAEMARTGKSFDFNDCSIGNLVFAGGFLLARRDFNRAVEDYCDLLGLPTGLIQNVTDGTNAYLVATGIGGELLASEEAVVDARRQNRIDQIYLTDRALTADEAADLAARPVADRETYFSAHRAEVRVNPEVVERLNEADLIIYAPGTQHSSLFPSYLTPGLSDTIATNLRAIKLIITNLQRDAEITGASAVDLIDRALYYLRDKGRLTIPTPCLVTHYLLNDPTSESQAAYVPLGAVDALEDPRLVRIGNYEDGVTGRHDAEKVLGPFLRSLLGSDREPAVAVYLHDGDSPNKITQTLLEMVRGGVTDLPLALTVVHLGDPIDAGFAASLPFAVRAVPKQEINAFLRSSGFEYVVLVESSGMYRGEDVVALASQVVFVRLDAVWGSRRLSLKDVEEAFRLRYERKWLQAAASHFGSHALSLLYLLLYGRYVSDTLSGLRAVRAKYLAWLDVDPAHKLANHQLLSALLRDRAEILETPVRFFPISPGRVKRTSVVDGLRAMLEILVRRFRRRPVQALEATPGRTVSPDKTVPVGRIP